MNKDVQMPKQLTTQNATITTAAVQVKTLTISGKQVTLAVFRQLREEPLIAYDGTLNGVPWGYVNYHPDKCGDTRIDHWHIVWQRGEELLRCRVDATAPFDQPGHRFQAKATDTYAAWLLGQWVHGNLEWCPLVRDRIVENRIQERYFCRWTTSGMSVEGIVVDVVQSGTVEVIEAAKNRLDRAQAVYDRKAGQWQANDLAAAQEDIRKPLADLDAQLAELGSVKQVRADYEAALAAETARRHGHRNLRTALADLPQLFIAV